MFTVHTTLPKDRFRQVSRSRWRRWNAKMSGELTRSLFGRWARAATDSEQHQFSKFLNFTQQLSLNLISLFSTNAKKADFRFPQFVSLRSYEQLFSNIKCPIKMISCLYMTFNFDTSQCSSKLSFWSFAFLNFQQLTSPSAAFRVFSL